MGTAGKHWVDSVFNTLSPDRRIGQLFMVAAYSNRDKAHVNEIKKLIRENGIGGLIFFQGGPQREAHLTNQYQNLTDVPLLISIDGEWGLAMRLDSTVQYPRQMTLGAIQDDSLIYYMGREIAIECKRLGIQVNLAPVADVNNNPSN
ncbi:MAG TPA: glycoside hydrolase family 3 N-terminal domain-containing protein, partial [Bacteroidia bacterium]|nr:glycoside hydrolase family 3 N-terminal domain-containing protein [Bacteroidia bacterium]